MVIIKLLEKVFLKIFSRLTIALFKSFVWSALLLFILFSISTSVMALSVERKRINNFSFEIIEDSYRQRYKFNYQLDQNNQIKSLPLKFNLARSESLWGAYDEALRLRRIERRNSLNQVTLSFDLYANGGLKEVNEYLSVKTTSVVTLKFNLDGYLLSKRFRSREWEHEYLYEYIYPRRWRGNSHKNNIDEVELSRVDYLVNGRLNARKSRVKLAERNNELLYRVNYYRKSFKNDSLKLYKYELLKRNTKFKKDGLFSERLDTFLPARNNFGKKLRSEKHRFITKGKETERWFKGRYELFYYYENGLLVKEEKKDETGRVVEVKEYLYQPLKESTGFSFVHLFKNNWFKSTHLYVDGKEVFSEENIFNLNQKTVSVREKKYLKQNKGEMINSNQLSSQVVLSRIGGDTTEQIFIDDNRVIKKITKDSRGKVINELKYLYRGNRLVEEKVLQLGGNSKRTQHFYRSEIADDSQKSNQSKVGVNFLIRGEGDEIGYELGRVVFRFFKQRLLDKPMGSLRDSFLKFKDKLSLSQQFAAYRGKSYQKDQPGQKMLQQQLIDLVMKKKIEGLTKSILYHGLDVHGYSRITYVTNLNKNLKDLKFIRSKKRGRSFLAIPNLDSFTQIVVFSYYTGLPRVDFNRDWELKEWREKGYIDITDSQIANYKNILLGNRNGSLKSFKEEVEDGISSDQEPLSEKIILAFEVYPSKEGGLDSIYKVVGLRRMTYNLTTREVISDETW